MAENYGQKFEDQYGVTAAEASSAAYGAVRGIIGYETVEVERPPVERPGALTVGPERRGRGAEVEMRQSAIMSDTIRQAIGALGEQEQKAIAYEIFLGVPGAYGGDYERIFNDDGSLDMTNFQVAVEGVIGLAEEAVAYDNTYFLDILRRGDVGEMTPAELAKAFQDRVAEIEAERTPKRVVNYMDPAGLQAALNDASASVLGRKMTNDEMKAFVSKIHGMQASGISSIAVGAQAEQFARAAAPVEAGAMDYSNAASLIMQAAGIGGRR